MFVITGATGKTGSRIAAALLAEKQAVRLLVRSPEKVKALAGQGAEVVQGSLSDSASFKKAVEGCTGIYLLTPLNWTSPDPSGEEISIGKALAEVLTGTTAHVIYLSVLKARDKTGIPHFDSKAEIETALEAACTNLTVLRPGFFFENFMMQIPAIASKRTVSMTLPPDQPVAMVSCKEIAEIVKQALMRGPKAKEFFDVIGLRCYTMSECARYIGNVLGRSVYYERVPDEQWAKGMKAGGASSRAIQDVLTMYRYFEQTRFTGDFDAVRKAFKYTSITFEKFAEDLVAAMPRK